MRQNIQYCYLALQNIAFFKSNFTLSEKRMLLSLEGTRRSLTEAGCQYAESDTKECNLFCSYAATILTTSMSTDTIGPYL